MMIYPRLRIEASYSSTLIVIWVLILLVLSWIANLLLLGLTILLLSFVALTSTHGESRMLFPLFFLAERLLDDVIALDNAPFEFYASTLLSFLTLVVCRRERRGSGKRNICFGTIFYAIVGLTLVFFICNDSVISLGAGMFVASGFIFFLFLRSALGENEAVLVSTIVGFYICDVVINNTAIGAEAILTAPGVFTTKTHIVSRGAMLCAIYLSIVLCIGSKFCMIPRIRNSKSCEKDISVSRITTLFWCSFICIIAVMYAAVSLQFKEDSFMWLWKYITSSSYRIKVIIIWAITLPLSVIIVDKYTGGLRKTARRKLFHFIAVIAFTPVAISDPHFLSLSLSIAATLSVIIELARFYKVYGSSTLSKFIVKHIDDRDSIRGVVRTHIYLIYGLGLSMMLRYRHAPPQFNNNNNINKPPQILELSVNLIPGLVALGIVDACAGIVGSTFLFPYRRALGRYLSNRFYTEKANISITHKTTTGTLGGLLSGIIFWGFILLVARAPAGVTGHTFFLILVCSVTECFMDGIDNLQLPLVVNGVVHTLFVILFRTRGAWE